jgi:hypothetical protein
MNMTTSVDSFDKLKLFSGVADESTSTKRYFPQTEGVRTCCRLWQRSVHLQAFWDFQRNLLSVEAGLFSAWGEGTNQ